MKTNKPSMPNAWRFVARCAPLALFVVLSAPAIFAQDSSGNGLLSGSYRFRYIGTVNYNSTGNVTETTAAQGVITFDGNGNYTINPSSQYVDNTISSGKFQTYGTGYAGTYVINGAGLGYISNPDPVIAESGGSNEVVFGTFSHGVFTGSSTESGSALNDLFVVMSAGTPPTNSSFNTPYWIGALDFAIGGDADVKNALFKISPNGSGGLGTISVQGQAHSQGATALTQTISGGTYNFAADGGATLTLPAPSGVATPAVMVSGSRLVYESADGNYLLGWTPNGYDLMFGVKALTASGSDSLFSGLYYIAGMGDQPPLGSTTGCGASSFWGSDHADGKEDEVVHQRFWSPYCALGSGQAGVDYGLDDFTTMNADGTATDATFSSLYAFGVGGGAFVGITDATTNGGTVSLTIGIQSPSFTPSGVFLNPVGVVNAASWDPITAGVAPGELITLFGSNLASTTVVSTGGQQFPTSLGNVSVTVGGLAAPIYYVSPTSISVIAPYGLSNLSTYTAEIQVNNAGLLSNQISVYLTDANSGFFSQLENGIGDAIAEHANGSLITEANPAAPGETIVMALTGMGAVTPAIADGAVGPPNPNPSKSNNFTTANQLVVYFNDYANSSTGQQATVQYAGLYPGLAGLYQMNVTVPTSVGPGDVYVEIITDNADVEQVTVPVGKSSTAAVSAALRPAGVPAPHPVRHLRARPGKFSGTQLAPGTLPKRHP